VKLSSPLLLPGIYMTYEYLEHDLDFTRLRTRCGRRVETLYCNGEIGTEQIGLDSSQRLPSDIMLSSRPATGSKETVRVKRVQSLLSAVKTARAMAAMFLVVL
jgi:hypothetical protein